MAKKKIVFSIEHRANLSKSLKGKQSIASKIQAIKTHCLKGHEYTLENTIYQYSRGRKSRVCKECKNIRQNKRYKQDKNKNLNFERNCPKCEIILYYASKISLNNANKRNSHCRKCSIINCYGEKLTIFERNCQKCNKIIKYKSQKLLTIAIRRNSLCRSCSGKRKILSKETKEKISNSLKGKMAGNKNPMFGKEVSEETRKEISKAHKGRISREKNPNWKGGVTALNKQIRYCAEYKVWRNICFVRDFYTCQNCGKKNCNLQCHHIIFLHIIKEKYNITTLAEAIKCKELWDINNGKTLCKDCHYGFHKEEKKS